MSGRGDILSIVIATRDRAGFLVRCLNALASATFDRDRLEVLVVNNASCDGTPRILEEELRRNRLPLTTIHEPRPGLAFARNTGVESAQGNAIIFLDDDALVTRGCLAAYDRLLRIEERPIVQGRILARFLGPRPRWISDAMLSRLSHLDQGDAARPLQGPIFGANFGVRRQVFDRIGLFRTDLGAGAIGLGEDTDFGLRAAAADFQATYSPDALVYHLIPRERTTRSAFLRRFYRSGLCQPLFKEYHESVPRLLAGLPRASLAHLLTAVLATGSTEHMSKLCELAEHLGRFTQILRQRFHG